MKKVILNTIKKIIKEDPYISPKHLDREAYEIITDNYVVDSDFDEEFDKVFAEYLATTI